MAHDRAESLRTQYLLEAERWAFAVSDWEIATVSAVLMLVTVRVIRLDAAFLTALGMVPKQCHQNAREFVGRMKGQGARMITGWIKKPRVLTLHSIVELGGRYFCVTPTLAEPRLEFDFIPDDMIKVCPTAGGISLCRDDMPLGIGLRRFARVDQPWFAEAVARLRSGGDPDEALRFTLARPSR